MLRQDAPAAVGLHRRRRRLRWAAWIALCATFCLSTNVAQAQSGPVITFIGLTNAVTDQIIMPTGMSPSGDPIYQLPAGTGFRLLIEARPGQSHLAVGTSTLNSVPGDAAARPDLQILTDQPLGDGSAAVCDPLGGVPATAGADYPPTTQVADALNDFACRFTSIGQSAESCVQFGGDYRFANASSTLQFCSQPLAPAFAFPAGNSRISVRIRDTGGNVGPVVYIELQVGPPLPTATPTSTPATPPATLSRSPTAAATVFPTSTRTPTATPSVAVATPRSTATTTGPLLATSTPTPPLGCELEINDANVSALLEALFTAEPPPVPAAEFDVNRDGRTNAADVIAFFALCELG